MADKIKAVLFDLGDTLLNYGKIDPHVPFVQAARQTWIWLKEQGQIAGLQLIYTVRSLLAIKLRMIWSHFTQHDFDSFEVLKRLGKKMGHQLTDAQYEDLVWLWYEPLARLVTIEPDLHQTLAMLKKLGLRMGIVSNTFVSSAVLNRHIRQLGLYDFFDFIYYSYMFDKRKPHPDMFLSAAKQLKLQPHQIMFVGDRIDNDINGSLAVGMIPVLKETYATVNKIVPPAVKRIKKISELPSIIEMIENDE